MTNKSNKILTLLMAISVIMLFAPNVLANDNTKVDLNVLNADGGELLRAYLMNEAEKQFKARQFEVNSLSNSGELILRQERLHSDYRKILGQFPKKTPLNPQITGTIDCKGYRIENVVFESRPNFYVTANLYIPSKGKKPYPGVLVVSGHWAEAKAWHQNQKMGALCAINGLVALVVDPISQGERMQLIGPDGQPAKHDGKAVFIKYFEHSLIDTGARLVGTGAAAIEAWDNIRSIDYLLSRPEVDAAKKIGCTGASGGGTQTTFIMALDERVGPAAPSCFLTTSEWTFKSSQPMNDGCQHIADEGKYGIERTDYLLIHAPNPTLVLAAQNDFFDINNTRKLAEDAKKFYTTLGIPERMDIFVAPGGHSFSKPHRQKAAQWFRRWLLDDNTPIAEPNIVVQKASDLNVTQTGQVGSQWPNSINAFDIAKQYAIQLDTSRKDFWKNNTKKQYMAKIKELIRFKPTKKVKIQKLGLLKFENYNIEKLIITHENGIPIPALLYLPNKRQKTTPAILYVDSEGKKSLAEQGNFLREKLNKGIAILAIDVRGGGETKDSLPYRYKSYMANEDWVNEMLAMHIGIPFMGQRVTDVLAALDILVKMQNIDPASIELVAVGWCGPVALHAAAIDERIKKVTLKNSITTWMTLLNEPLVLCR